MSDRPRQVDMASYIEPDKTPAQPFVPHATQIKRPFLRPGVTRGIVGVATSVALAAAFALGWRQGGPNGSPSPEITPVPTIQGAFTGKINIDYKTISQFGNVTELHGTPVSSNDPGYDVNEPTVTEVKGMGLCIVLPAKIGNQTTNLEVPFDPTAPKDTRGANGIEIEVPGTVVPVENGQADMPNGVTAPIDSLNQVLPAPGK